MLLELKISVSVFVIKAVERFKAFYAGGHYFILALCLCVFCERSLWEYDFSEMYSKLITVIGTTVSRQ